MWIIRKIKKNIAFLMFTGIEAQFALLSRFVESKNVYSLLFSSKMSASATNSPISRLGRRLCWLSGRPSQVWTSLPRWMHKQKVECWGLLGDSEIRRCKISQWKWDSRSQATCPAAVSDLKQNDHFVAILYGRAICSWPNLFLVPIWWHSGKTYASFEYSFPLRLNQHSRH
jgi:hypothetical protein